MRNHVITMIAALLLASAASATAQSSTGDDVQRELLGVLVHTRVTVDLDHVPVRLALKQLADALGATIIGRYEDDDVGHGLDPTAPITLRLVDGTALDALEMILDQATLYEEATWQLRTGFIEVGTKRRLCASTRRRLYDLSDLLLDPPYFSRTGTTSLDLDHFRKHPYRSASLRVSWGDLLRQNPQQLLEELIRAMTEAIEPANWNFVLSDVPPLGPDPVLRTSGAVAWQSDDHRIAKIRQWKQQSLFITAPDFVHRQIGGYGPPIVPALRDSRPERTPPPSGPISPSGVTRVGVDALRGAAPQTVWSALAAASRVEAAQDDDDSGKPRLEPLVIDGRLTGDVFRRHAVEVLLGTRVNLSFDAIPAREAIARLQRRLDVPIIARFDDDRLGFGIDPHRVITLALEDATALDALTAILDDCSTPEDPCTWQIRRGYLELGSKSRLSVPAARELRLYHIRDLMLDIPKSHHDKRKLPAGIALDLVETIVKKVEPDAWDWGQIDYYVVDDGGSGVRVSGGNGSGGGGGSKQGPAPDPAKRARPRYVEIQKPAIIRHWRDVLIVAAPDFIHRQLGGADGLAGLPADDPARP